MRRRKELVSYFMLSVFPRRCGFCGTVIAPAKDVCAECEKNLSRVMPPVCRICGRGKEECLCKGYQSFYTGLAAPFYYEGSVQKCIWQLKFHGKTQNAAILALEMSKTAKAEYKGIQFDFVTCVPLTKSSLRERGFNQSALLANETGKLLDIDVDTQLIKKIYDTPAQHTMNSSMRRGNLLGVFEAANSEKISGKKILICDDVATTGSTLNECTKMLLLAGAEEVYCLTAAVTRQNK